MYRFRIPVITLIGLAAVPSVARAQNGPCDTAPGDPVGPSRDLYCLELVPVPGIVGAAGRVELRHRPHPFTVDVSPNGSLRYDPIAHVTGLPDPATLGAYSSYVAWVAPPIMSPLSKLGGVGNGSTALAPIDLDKFVVLITAEASVNVTRPAGRVILRGLSASTRMQPADLFQFSIGAVPESTAEHPGDHMADRRGWTMVPMPPNVTMLPALMRLRPTVSPFLPERPEAPLARPRELVRLGDGDTLRLMAGFVRRTLRGRTYTMYAFNGQHPGPLIWVPRGAQIVVDFTNRIDWPTTVHWHGIRLDNRFDGVPDVTQPPVPPGGSFVYRIRFPDAGIYWYHPHLREDVQQDLGLYGNLMVRPSRSDYWSPVHREEVLMLDDLLLGEQGLAQYGQEAATHALMGRFGNLLLVNGEPSYRLTVARGEVVRFFLTNASNTRTFNVSFPGARMKVVGSDVGSFEREAWVESVVIAPAERYVVHARFDEPGVVPFVNRVRGVDHLYGRFFPESDTLGVVVVDSSTAHPDLRRSFGILREDSETRSEIDRYRTHFARPPDRTLTLAIRTGQLPLVTERLMQLDSVYFSPVEWSGTMPMMNWAATAKEVRWILEDLATGKQNVEIDDWHFRVGEVVKIRLVNRRESFHAMQHPIHLHGQRFLILGVNGVANENLVWKDTVLLPVGTTVDILLELSNPGRWMLHCHIAEHIESGMMMTFTVE